MRCRTACFLHVQGLLRHAILHAKEMSLMSRYMLYAGLHSGAMLRKPVWQPKPKTVESIPKLWNVWNYMLGDGNIQVTISWDLMSVTCTAVHEAANFWSEKERAMYEVLCVSWHQFLSFIEFVCKNKQLQILRQRKRASNPAPKITGKSKLQIRLALWWNMIFKNKNWARKSPRPVIGICNLNHVTNTWDTGKASPIAAKTGVWPVVCPRNVKFHTRNKHLWVA